MSLYQKSSLVQIPSGYKAADAKLYSVVPNSGDGDFTVSVDADATRVNKDGLIETTVANQARLNYDPTNPQDPHLLLEPARTNLLQRSGEFDNSYWTKARASITANQTTAPDGANTADKLFDSTDNNTHIVFRSLTVSTSNSYTFSCFLKKGSLDKAFLSFDSTATQSVVFDLENGTVFSEGSGVTSSSIVEFPNNWYKCSFTHTPTTTTRLYRIGTYNGSISYAGTGTDFVYIFGAQLEEGNYPTSYIPTTTAQVTRTEDNCFINSGLQNILNTSEGTLFVDVEVPRVSTSLDYERIALTDQTSGTDRILIDDFGGNWRVVVISSAGTQTASIRSTQANTRIKIAFTYSSSQIRVSYDGNNATTTSISYTPSTTLESFKFSNKDGGNKWQGKIYQAMYFDTALTNAELQTLTS